MQAVSSAGFGTARPDTRAEDDLVPGSKILGGKSSCKRGSMPMRQDMAEIKNVAAGGNATLASLGAGRARETGAPQEAVRPEGVVNAPDPGEGIGVGVLLRGRQDRELRHLDPDVPVPSELCQLGNVIRRIGSGQVDARQVIDDDP